ncbi:hypothetical protein [Actinomadura madurae]|uniref:hypothetical protein n=1 Tax=Actinomadura madurae TaxID=1993 RepID=UPI0020D1FD23|nr:hypothetical protein [Actinomadura madurae]MCQ0018639.1 hypothetical protein [Actinomadura madurae]
MARTTARRASNASMSRNSSPAAPGGATSCHVRPASVVRRTAPPLPASQATFPLTAASPRKRASPPVGVSRHPGPPAAARAVPGTARDAATTAPHAPATARVRTSARIGLMGRKLTRDDQAVQARRVRAAR